MTENPSPGEQPQRAFGEIRFYQLSITPMDKPQRLSEALILYSDAPDSYVLRQRLGNILKNHADVLRGDIQDKGDD